MAIIPYVVLAGVVLLFFVVIYLLVFGFHGKKEAEEELEELEQTLEMPRVKPAEKPAKKPVVDDATQIIPVKPKRHPAPRPVDEEEKTRIFTKEDFGNTRPVARPTPVKEQKTGGKSPFPPEGDPFILPDHPSTQDLRTYFIRHFLNQYGAVSKTVAQDTERVTDSLIRSLRLSDKEAVDTLSHIMVQEAMQNAQRAYVMMPTPLVLAMVCDAFADVAHGSRSETKTILAYDALRAMPRMDEAEFRALSLLLIFHYSRNTDNFDAIHLKRYADTYVAPFLTKLPGEYSGYQQMEYLHCVSLQNKEIPFGQVLHDSYPLVFAFRGCMKAELAAAYPSWPEGSIVPSLYNSYYKPAAVDESMLSGLLDDMGIEDVVQRRSLQALVESRPVAYDRKEMGNILSKISPKLKELQDEWDTSMLRRSSLTLMGMYIAKICIRETIGEDFDLSSWM